MIRGMYHAIGRWVVFIPLVGNNVWYVWGPYTPTYAQTFAHNLNIKTFHEPIHF